MEKATVSPALSKIEARIEEFKEIEKTLDTIDFDIITAKNRLESLQFARAETLVTKEFLIDRISELVKEAEEGEGFTTDYIARFLKERNYHG